MEQYLDIHTTCRICLNQNETLRNLLENSDNDNNQMLQLFINIIDLELNLCDNPYKICNSCCLKLQSIQEFIDSSRQNHQLMMQHIEKVTNNINQNTEEAISINVKTNDDNYNSQSENSNIKNVSDTINPTFSQLSHNDQIKIDVNDKDKMEFSTNYIDNFNKINIVNDDAGSVLLQNESTKSSDENCGNDRFVKDNSENDDEISDGFDEEEFVGKKTSTGLKIKKRLTQFPHEVVLSEIELIRNDKKLHVQCVKCHFVTTKIRYLISHMKFLHKDVINYWCQHCNSEVDNLSEHSVEHNDDIKCTFCNKVFKKKSNLLEHLFCHSDKQMFKCEICNQTFATKGSLLKHTNECDDTKAENRKNKEKISRLPDSALCSICGKEFKTQSKLEVHMRSHTGFSPYKCSHCDKRTSTRSQLVMHERTHTGEKPYSCNICGKGFAQSGVLKTHMRQHTGRPDVCMICDKRFCRPALLKIHMRKHTGEKPYICSDCGLSFKQQSHLTDHEKTHSDERPYQCEICMRGFRQKSSLKTHINIHLGEKPFKCKHCPYACRQSYSLTQHMKQHTENE